MNARSNNLSVFNYTINNQADGEIDVNIDGYIVDAPTQELLREFWGDETSVSFKSIRNQIDQAKPKTINLYVNSGGGHVGDAMAMHDYLVELENKGTKVNRVGRGIVASAATYLVVGNNSSMTENSWFMIHNVQGGIWGDVNVIENYAKTMRKFNNAIRDFYANVSGQAPEQVSAMMNKETWLTAKEAKEKGFVSEVTGKADFKNSIKAEHWQYSNTAVLNAYNSFTNSNSNHMDITKVTEAITNGFSSLMEKLGLKDKAEDEGVKNAFADFSKSITDALGNISTGITEERVTELTNTAIADALKNIAENEAFKTALTNATKSAITKDDLKNEMDALVTKITNQMGNKSGGETEEKEKKKTGVKNRFSTATGWSVN